MTQNRMTRYLIADAGGSHGKTGNHVARQLLNRKLPVRAFVFHADQRSKQLEALRAEVVAGEYLSRVGEAHQRGEPGVQTDIVQRIGGAAPKLPDVLVAENRAVFTGENLHSDNQERTEQQNKVYGDNVA